MTTRNMLSSVQSVQQDLQRILNEFPNALGYYHNVSGEDKWIDVTGIDYKFYEVSSDVRVIYPHSIEVVHIRWKFPLIEAFHLLKRREGLAEELQGTVLNKFYFGETFKQFPAKPFPTNFWEDPKAQGTLTQSLRKILATSSFTFPIVVSEPTTLDWTRRLDYMIVLLRTVFGIHTMGQSLAGFLRNESNRFVALHKRLNETPRKSIMKRCLQATEVEFYVHPLHIENGVEVPLYFMVAIQDKVPVILLLTSYNLTLYSPTVANAPQVLYDLRNQSLTEGQEILKTPAVKQALTKSFKNRKLVPALVQLLDVADLRKNI